MRPTDVCKLYRFVHNEIYEKCGLEKHTNTVRSKAKDSQYIQEIVLSCVATYYDRLLSSKFGEAIT